MTRYDPMISKKDKMQVVEHLNKVPRSIKNLITCFLRPWGQRNSSQNFL